MRPIPITTLTPAAVQQSLQSDGLDTLGLTTVSLARRWSDTTPAAANYDSTNLTLNLSGLRAPFRGIREFTFSAATSTLALAITGSSTTIRVAAGEGNRFPSPTAGQVLLTLSDAAGAEREIVACTARSGDTLTVERGVGGTAKQSFGVGDRVSLRLSAGTRTSQFYVADGTALTGPCTVLRLHPQATLRLETLAAGRYATGGNLATLPIPHAMVVRGVQGFTTARWFEPDEAMPGIAGRVSFHDGRGLIIDPIYVAALFADLQAALPGLTGKSAAGSLSGPGGVQAIAALASGVLVHVLDLHGNIYRPAAPGATLVMKSSSNIVTGPVAPNGLALLSAGDGVDAAATDQGRLRWGWAKNGVLGRTRLVPPALPTTGPPAPSLPRRFYQVAVVDTEWALRGNRTNAPVLGIRGDDQTMPAEALPAVRDNVVIDYLVDGPDVLGQSAAVLARPSRNMVLAVSPALNGAMDVPSQPGPNAHWPAFPTPATDATFPSPPASPAEGIAATFTSGNDVVVTIAADRAPDGAHIRVYPRQFVLIPAIPAEPSFVRADGGAGIARAGERTQILLRNPFALPPGQPRPSPANLTMDIVVAPRAGARRLWGAVTVVVAAGPAAAPTDPFGGDNGVADVPVTFESIAPVPLFDIPTTVITPESAPSDAVGFVRALASETQPRQGPRPPTMARFDTVITTGATGGTPSGTLLWEAVLSGGRWGPETRSAQHADGNPGNPAGPDIHAAGVRVTGGLAYDLARHAMRRAQPVIPLGGGTPGWVVGMGGDNFNPPQDSNTANTGVGAVLETVAAICETPELSMLTPPPPGTTVQQMVNMVADALHVTRPSITVKNEPRLQAEIRREFLVSRHGLRDAIWSLLRAVREARELIYIESPQLAHTGATVDLIVAIETALKDHPNLCVLVCTPREPDFSPRYRGWWRQHFSARNRAIGDLVKVAPERVAVFHPVGFPGRTAFTRTTTVIIDDVWCLVGATHWRRRGLTFDGSVAVASFDRQMDNGYSNKVRAFRRQLMAAKLGIPTPTGSPTAEWVRLSHPEPAFALVRDWLDAGGLGRIQPLWSGPADTTILPAPDDMADPDGSDGSKFVDNFKSLLAETGD
jgi:hypothetical protein